MDVDRSMHINPACIDTKNRAINCTKNLKTELRFGKQIVRSTKTARASSELIEGQPGVQGANDRATQDATGTKQYATRAAKDANRTEREDDRVYEGE